MASSRTSLGIALALVLPGCMGKGEAEREAEIMRAATPIRLQADGTIRLSDAERAALDLIVEEASEGDLPSTSLRYGKTRARTGDEALVVSPVAGRVSGPPPVDLGARVAEGAAIVDVVPVLSAADRVSIGVQGADLRGQLSVAARELAQREAAHVRARELAASGLASAARVEETDTALATTRARLDALQQAQAVHLRGGTASLTLRSPVDGTIVSLEAPVGAIVHEGEVLARIHRAAPLWVDVAVRPDEPAGLGYEVLAGSARVGARLLARGAVVADDGARHDRLEIEGPAAGLLPGETVAVSVARDIARGVVVPEAAVVPGGRGDLVYVEVAPGSFAPRSVQVAARFAGKVRLASGLRAGERVVVQGVMSLRGEALRADLGQ